MKYHVFVYGTLRTGQSNWEWALKDRAKFIGFAKTKGRLYRLGGFPGLRFGEGYVYGEVFEVDEDTLKDLDRLEGVDHGFYVRMTVPIEYIKLNGEDTPSDCEYPNKVYVYVYGNQPLEHNLIQSGDWLIKE